MKQSTLSVRGAAEHNLKDVDVDLPHGRLIAFSGVSGSGKSSLVFDTIYAEARRRFLLTLDTAGKTALKGLRAPRVREISGLAPAIGIDQDRGRQSPRSTVATLSGLYDYLRVLFARLGEPRCLSCGSAVQCHRYEEVYESAAGLPEGTRLLVLAPRPTAVSDEEFLADVERTGYRRLRVDGQVRLIEELDSAALAGRVVQVVVDRLVVKGDSLQRLKGSLQAALEVGDGQVGFVGADSEEEEQRYSVHPACATCGRPFTSVTPALLSFNSRVGACPACRGLGTERELSADRVLAAGETLEETLGPLWREFDHHDLRVKIEQFCLRRNVDFEMPLAQWSDDDVERLWRGDGRRGGFAGLGRWLDRLSGVAADEELAWLEGRLGDAVCATCNGARLSPEALAVKIGEHSIATIAALTVQETLQAIGSMRFEETGRSAVAEVIAAEVRQRLGTMADLGLGYLRLDRGADTLSCGEFQRTRLAAVLGAGMTQVLYVLDEPSVGLHARDAQRLAAALTALSRAGNTVLVVEHDPAIIGIADMVVDLGPGAGVNGGYIVSSGTPEELAAAGSPTGKYLGGTNRHRLAPSRQRSTDGERLQLLGASGHNLKDVDIDIPLGCLVLVTGVSGSGKTSLIRHTLHPLLAARLHKGERRPLPFREFRGTELVNRVLAVGQRPMGRTSRSNTATYTGVMTDIRRLFAELPEARMRGYNATNFSFNSAQGACAECGGSGSQGIRRGVLEDLVIVCPRCQGQRYNTEVLQVVYRHHSIGDVLALGVDEALTVFGAVPQVARRLALLQEMGLGYLRLGQPASTLSGGEAQRVKLCAELCRQQQARTLYILDEPTSGLHLDDIHFLAMLLQRLVDGGNTVLVVEHNIELIAAADHIIDLGPEAGAGGGEVVASGTPQAVAEAPASHTGRYLKHYLEDTGDEGSGEWR